MRLWRIVVFIDDHQIFRLRVVVARHTTATRKTEKLSVSDRTAAVTVAIARGILPMPR